jgi:hypothetical protein
MSARAALEALFRTATNPAAFEWAAVAYLSLQESVDVSVGSCSLRLYRLGISEWTVVRHNKIMAVTDHSHTYVAREVVLALAVLSTKEHILKCIAENQHLDAFGCQLDFKTMVDNMEFK